MRARGFLSALLILAWLDAAPAVGQVLLRIASGPLPSAEALGVKDIVVHWPVQEGVSLAKLSSLGFRVFLQADGGNIEATANAADRADLAGVIIDASGPASVTGSELLRLFKEKHSKLVFRILMSGGKQPQMRGRLVVNRDGILQVSSPSSQPWLDTNLAAVALAEAFHPEFSPVLYDFHWDLSDAVHKELGPSAEEFALAVSEAQAIHADVILDLPDPLQKALAAEQPQAWSSWNRVKRYLAFSSTTADDVTHPVANIGVVTCDDSSNYEALNLLARHNLAFAMARPQDLAGKESNRWKTLLVFCSSDDTATEAFHDFAKRGGLLIMVNQSGHYPWHAKTPSRQDAQSATFSVGTGEIIELREPVTDPEAFARDLRRLIGPERSALALWNSLTTLVTGYRNDAAHEIILHLINYADVPDNVQIRIKGRYASVQFESPEDACCRPLRAFERNGFTEFTVPRLAITATVHLKSADSSPVSH